MKMLGKCNCQKKNQQISQSEENELKTPLSLKGQKEEEVRRFTFAHITG